MRYELVLLCPVQTDHVVDIRHPVYDGTDSGNSQVHEPDAHHVPNAPFLLGILADQGSPSSYVDVGRLVGQFAPSVWDAPGL